MGWIALVATLCILTASPAKGVRRALLIGIGDYSGRGLAEPLPKDRWPEGTRVPENRWHSLKGPANDVGAMASVVKRIDAATQVTILRDSEATREGILQAIEALIAASRPRDEVLFYFAGHGSQVRSTAADPDEVDGLDETLVPADSVLGAADIRDTELRQRFNRLLDRKARLTVILDSCHSASGVRGDPGWASPRSMKPVFVPRLVRLKAGPPLEERGAVIIAAARDDQPARERSFGEQHYGVFTKAFTESFGLDSRPEGEAIAQLVQRTQARLRLYEHMQDPVLTARADRRRDALFGGQTDHRDGSIAVAVERVENNRIVLQGGWVYGLTVGSELRAGESSEPYARVVEVDGPGRAIAEVMDMVPKVGRSTEPAPPIESGSLLQLMAWAPPRGEALRLWIPDGPYEVAVGMARELSSRAARGRFHWVEDPTRDPITHVLDHDDGQWALHFPDSSAKHFQEKPAVEAIEALLDETAHLFFRLPPPCNLVRPLLEAWDEMPVSIERVDDPAAAQYLLAGSLHRGGPMVTWLHRSSLDARYGRLDPPARSSWIEWMPTEGATRGRVGLVAGRLAADARALGRIYGWLTLESHEPRGQFPYDLAVLPYQEQARPAAALERDQQKEALTPGGFYELALVGPDGVEEPVPERWIYVFTIDPHGRSQLLYPRSGGQSHHPQTRPAPRGIVLDGTRFKVVPPLGTDHYFLFASSERIHNLGVFEWDPVRSGVRGAPASALEQLLEDRTTGTRAADLTPIPAEWSLHKLTFDTMPALAAASRP